MRIHWFPGHMKKALRVMREQLKMVDSIIYVLDSRAPLSSINPQFDELIAHKPVLYVLNKSDMVNSDDILKWQRCFEKENKACVANNSLNKGGGKIIINKLLEINAAAIEKYRNKGVNKTIRAMVIGIPNCGKSALINSLTSGKKTVTGNKPGVTRGRQWVVIDKYIELMDTPGTLFPDFGDEKKALNLAFIGSIKDDILDINELASKLLDCLTSLGHGNKIAQRYNLQSETSSKAEMLRQIGLSRGFILKGGEVDIEKTAKAVLTDFRKLAFGQIILEKA